MGMVSSRSSYIPSKSFIPSLLFLKKIHTNTRLNFLKVIQKNEHGRRKRERGEVLPPGVQQAMRGERLGNSQTVEFKSFESCVVSLEMFTTYFNPLI